MSDVLPVPFAWAGEHIGCELPGGRVLFTTRRGGVSKPPYDTLNLGLLTDDDPADVAANRARLATLTGVAAERTLRGVQVHEGHVRRVRELPQRDAPLEDADGQATALTGVAALVLTADCLPVALIAREAVAIVHAGWRGLAGGVLSEGVRALRELGAAGEIHAAIGPGAGVCCYETGPEVHAAFESYGPPARRGEHGPRPLDDPLALLDLAQDPDLHVIDELLVEARVLVAGQHRGQYIQHRIVLVEQLDTGPGVERARQLNTVFENEESIACEDDWSDPGAGRNRRPAGDISEVLLHERLGFHRIEVAGDGQRRVVRRIVGAEEALHVIERRRAQIRHRADHRPGIRMRAGIECGQNYLISPSVGNVIVALPSLVLHDVALQVELCLVHGREQKTHSVGIQPQGERQGVRRNVLVVVGAILGGRSVVVATCSFELLVEDTDADILGSHEHDVFE